MKDLVDHHVERRHLIGARRRTPMPLPDPVFRELMAMLFSMTIPILAMGLVFTSIAALIGIEVGDPVLVVIAAAGVLITIMRALVIKSFHRAVDINTEIVVLRRWERRYAVGSFLFAALLAAFSLHVLTYHSPLLHMIAVSLVLGFDAGILARISIRPAICVGSMLIATVPTAAGLAFHALGDWVAPLHAELFAAEALLVTMITTVGLNTVHHLHHAAVRHLTAQHDLTFLAKQDALTGLPNRLLLRERFLSSIDHMQQTHGHLALHFLDLDGFKAINDMHGHPAGDAILAEVARRLLATVRSGDTVARLGGDEFVVIQDNILHPGEAEMLGRRIIRKLGAPYEIGGEMMHISVSIGIALAPEQGLDLDQLASCADAALYRSKVGGGDASILPIRKIRRWLKQGKVAAFDYFAMTGRAFGAA